MGSEMTKLVPWPGSESTAMVPPLASMKPLAMASPSPEPVQGPVAERPAPVEGLEDPLALGRVDAGALVDHAHHNAVPGPAGMHRDGPLARVPARVLEQIGQRSLELGSVGADLRNRRIDRHPERGSGVAQALSRRGDEVLDRDPVTTRSCPAGLKP